MVRQKRPVISIDIDDVLAAGAQAFIEYSNERWGTNLTIDDYEDNWAKLWNLDRTSASDLTVETQRVEDFFANCLPRMHHDTSAYEVLAALKQDFDLIVVTARRLHTKADTLVWAEEHFPGIFDQDKIYFAGFYDTIGKHSLLGHKGDLLKELGAHYHIDDQPKHCNGAISRGVKAILFGDYAWQYKELVDENVVRVRTWPDILEYFNAERQRISN
jgi:5'(3')-deoxyribonucleotidase